MKLRSFQFVASANDDPMVVAVPHPVRPSATDTLTISRTTRSSVSKRQRPLSATHPPMKRNKIDDNAELHPSSTVCDSESTDCKSFVGRKVGVRHKLNVGPSSKVKYFPHLKPLPDSIEPNLICLFIGINPGVKTAETGHAYAHPSNWFWKLLHSGGCTDRLLPPRFDEHLPRLYSLGTTNLVARPTANQTQITAEEKTEGSSVLNAKIRKYRPEAVCFVGKDIWKCFYKCYFGTALDEKAFKFGWQKVLGDDVLIGTRAISGEDPVALNLTANSNHVTFASKIQVTESEMKVKVQPEDSTSTYSADWTGAKVFVSFSTSGLVSFSPEFKRGIWNELGAHINERRKLRGETSPRHPFEISDF
ncbi:hypothetical protein HDU84_000442 [Entophlyctis sp. JEL0112]|nr:hypothetical protein HDU84_000442 [Entophlyctis sp. JEL0112]